MVNVFLSRPTWVDATFANGLEGFNRILSGSGFMPRTVGTTDFPTKSPLDEVIRLMDICQGVIILGYPQIVATSGSIKDKPIAAPVALSTEWNHIEAGLAYAKSLPLLVIHHLGISRGIFDRGACSSFEYEIDLANESWSLRPDIQGALAVWKNDVLARGVAANAPVAAQAVAAVPATPTVVPDVVPRGATKISAYCSVCGAVPGVPSRCIEPFGSHSFVTSVGDAFCRMCGAVPGRSTRCIEPYGSHTFATA